MNHLDGNLGVTDHGNLGVTDHGNLGVTDHGNLGVTDGKLDVTAGNLDMQAIPGSEAMTWPAVTWGMPRGPRPPVKLNGTHLEWHISLSFNTPTC